MYAELTDVFSIFDYYKQWGGANESRDLTVYPIKFFVLNICARFWFI